MASKTRALGSLSRNPPKTWLAVSPSRYQSNSIVPSPRPRPAPGSRPVMYPSTDTASATIARTLDVIGEPWSPLILRDVYVGFTRFGQLQADLGISRKVLTERLGHLVERGVLERRPYDARPRYE